MQHIVNISDLRPGDVILAGEARGRTVAERHVKYRRDEMPFVSAIILDLDDGSVLAAKGSEIGRTFFMVFRPGQKGLRFHFKDGTVIEKKSQSLYTYWIVALDPRTGRMIHNCCAWSREQARKKCITANNRSWGPVYEIIEPERIKTAFKPSMLAPEGEKAEKLQRELEAMREQRQNVYDAQRRYNHLPYYGYGLGVLRARVRVLTDAGYFYCREVERLERTLKVR